MTLTLTRPRGRPLKWCSDGWRGYAAILTRAYRQPVHSGQPGRPPLVVPSGVRLTQTIKHRDAHGKLLSIEIRAALGEVIPQPATVHIERVNGTLRDRLNALTRKTHAFAKRDATWDALVHLQLFEHNWIRPHRTLRLPMPTENATLSAAHSCHGSWTLRPSLVLDHFLDYLLKYHF